LRIRLREINVCLRCGGMARWPRIAQHVGPEEDLTMLTIMPALWLVRVAIAGVWIYEGLWCKILAHSQSELRVVQAVPHYGARVGALFLRSLGWVELSLGLWVLSGVAPGLCALAQTVLLVSLNAAGLTFSRHEIHDPAGMVFKNFAFLVLGWVNAGLSA
jgi:uncharacterized membrane protein YphA (DoxX/SURF4 family)